VRRLRLGILLAMLAAVSLWAAVVHHRHASRTRWLRPLDVAVVLLTTGDAVDTQNWQDGLGELERWIGGEMARYRRVIDDPPVRFELYGPLTVKAAPRFVPDDDGWWTRVRHAWSSWRELSALDARAHLGHERVRIYVMLEASAPSVEGAGEVGGDSGFVRATLDPDLSMALTATAHELFHCLGATDKYDAAGHALAPEGWVEPSRGLPQRFAEIMVGEVPLTPQKGALPRSLDEVRVGAATAVELHWSASLTPTGR
jgi:hypothetical protein